MLCFGNSLRNFFTVDVSFLIGTQGPFGPIEYATPSKTAKSLGNGT
jgi:hypothetical protein